MFSVCGHSNDLRTHYQVTDGMLYGNDWKRSLTQCASSDSMKAISPVGEEEVCFMNQYLIISFMCIYCIICCKDNGVNGRDNFITIYSPPDTPIEFDNFYVIDAAIGAVPFTVFIHLL